MNEIRFNDEDIFILDMGEDRISFSNGVSISSSHLQECCEHNYADFGSLKDTVLDGTSFNELLIELNVEYGMRINGEFVPFYSAQNGYYTSALDIEIYKDGSLIHAYTGDGEIGY